jgi:hypothetical protein
VVVDSAAGSCPDEGVMARHMARDAADSGTLEASLCLGCGRHSKLNDNETSDNYTWLHPALLVQLALAFTLPQTVAAAIQPPSASVVSEG